MSIRTIAVSGNALHCHYDRQTQSQPCYVELDCKTGTLSANYNAEIGNAVPFSVYHGHEQRWGIPCLTGDAATALLAEIEPLAERVVAGYESDWDGNNMVAKFSDDAQAAIDEIAALCDGTEADESNSIQAWGVGDWLQNGDKPTAETTDADLDQMVADAEPDEDNIVIDGDIEGYFNEIRYSARGGEIEAILDGLDTVDQYLNTASGDENPEYLVRFENGRCATVKYNADGKMIWTRSPLRPDNLTKTALGRAYCDWHNCTKEPGGHEPRRRPIEPATDYDAARCEAVPTAYRCACREKSTGQLYAEVQEQFRAANQPYFENKKQRAEIEEKIAELERQLDTLKKSLPAEVEPEYFSMGTNSAACQYKNLTGNYPKIEK